MRINTRHNNHMVFYFFQGMLQKKGSVRLGMSTSKNSLYKLTMSLSGTKGLPQPIYQNTSFYETWAASQSPSGKINNQQELFSVMQGAAQLGRYNVFSGTRVATWQL